MRPQKLNYTKFALTYYLVVFIPLLIIIVGFFFIQTQQVKKRLEKNIADQCRREATYWQDQMKVINSYIRNCRYNKLYYLEYSGNPKLANLEIMWDLKKKEANFPFVSGIYLVRKDGAQIVASKGVYSNKKHVEELIHMEEQLHNNMQGIYTYGDKVGQDGARLIIFTPIEIGKSTENRQFLTFVIPKENIQDQFSVSSVVNQYATEIYYMDDLIYQDTNVDGNISNCSTYRYDLGNGFWLLHKIPSIEKMGNIFLYLRGFMIIAVFTLLLGLYLAKRCSKERYGTLQSIIESKESLECERNALRQENCLYELLNQRINPQDDLWNRCMSNDIHLDRKYKFFIFISEECRNLQILDWITACVKESEPATIAYGIRIHEQLTSYLVCSNEDKKELEERIEFIRSSGEASASSICEDIVKLRRTYREARRNYYRMTGNKKIYPTVEMQAFQEAVELGDWQKGKILLDSILDFLPEIDCRMLIRLMNEISEVVDADMNIVYDRMNGNVCIDLLEFQETAKRQFMEKMQGSMEARVLDATDLQPEEGEKRKRNIVDVLFYIQEHYLEDDFSIKLMAANFDTTPSNLSHFFKKQMDSSLAQYIEGLKMEKAKEFLGKDHMKIVEIAALLGYRNSTAFIEVFKRREGMTPGVYRKNLAESAEE